MPKIVANLSSMGFSPDYSTHLYYAMGGDIWSHNKNTKQKRMVIKGAFVRMPKHAYYIKSVRGAYVVECRPMAEMKAKANAARTRNAKAKAVKVAKAKAVKAAKKPAKAKH